MSLGSARIEKVGDPNDRQSRLFGNWSRCREFFLALVSCRLPNHVVDPQRQRLREALRPGDAAPLPSHGQGASGDGRSPFALIRKYDEIMSISDPVSLTARWTAAARAVESRREDRLFNDPFAEALAGRQGFAFLQQVDSARRATGVTSQADNPYLTIRTRFIDDFLKGPLVASSVRQVVVVAAGLDARAYRLAWPRGTCVFELDRHEVLEAKRTVLDRLGAQPHCECRSVAVDLAHPWQEALVVSGFDKANLSLWIVEGLFPYLDEPGARGVLAQISALAKIGSTIVADVVGKSFLESAWTRPFLQALAAANAPWKFGCDHPDELFRSYGWDAVTQRPGEVGANYGRWPYPMSPPGTPGIPESFLVTAVRR